MIFGNTLTVKMNKKIQQANQVAEIGLQDSEYIQKQTYGDAMRGETERNLPMTS